MPSMLRGRLTAGLIAMLMPLSSTAVAEAAPARVVRGTADTTTRPLWTTGAWVHQHAYGVSAGDLVGHPEWQLKDGSNTPLSIGTRLAADFGNPAFRAWWIAKAQAAVASGYRGLYIDDVFMERRTTTSGGASRTAIDPRTGAAITEANWQKYMADFMVAVRAALPGAEIVHDVLWYKGDAGDVLRQLNAASFAVVDGGFNTNVTYGASTYGYQTLTGWAEREQTRGRGVIFNFGTLDQSARLYGLASYWLVTNGASAIANDALTAPGAFWWPYIALDLGTPSTARYSVATGAWRRDFTRGIVLVNEPYRAARTFTVPAGYQDLDGVARTSVTLSGGQGAVLTPIAPAPTPTATPTPVAPADTAAPVSPAPIATPTPVTPKVPTTITTVSTGGDRARIARVGGTAGAKAPRSTRVSVRGSRTWLSGRVKGAVAGYVRVTVERKRGAEWAVVRRVKVAVKRSGRFTKDIPTLPGGSYRVSGFFEGTGTTKPARSGYSTFG